MMPSEVTDILRLNDKIVSPMHQALLDHCEKLLKQSRECMECFYPDWDARHEIYMRRRPVDKNDVEATKQGLPRKIVVPLSYQQINTFVAFGYMLFTQRERFYEFNPVEDSDRPMRECGELLVHRDMQASNYKGNLVQSLLNVARFGINCEIDSYESEYVYVPISSTQPAPMFEGQPTGEATVTTAITKVLRRQGNSVRQISPYRIFVDPGFHITEWRRGAFFAWDDEFSRDTLSVMQADGLVMGVEHVDKYTTNGLEKVGRKAPRFAGINPKKPAESDVVVVTQMVVTLVPASIKDPQGKAFGRETIPHKWLIWIANDCRIIRAEPMTALHNQFPASISFFSPDLHEATLSSLAYMINDLQALVSWFMNSRMAAVTRTVDNQMIVDPLLINVDDVTLRHRVIRMQKAGAGKDVRRGIMPLEIKDSTQGHVADMAALTALMQSITGVNDNMSGQYNGGRRSATEARSTMTGAASRVKMVFDVMWGMAYQPQANRMLLNHRQAITVEEFTSVCGQAKAQQYFEQFRGTPEQLVRSYDFVSYDGTLPSEKLFMAQQLQELLMILMSNPASAAAFGMDPVKVLKQSMELRGMGTGLDLMFDQVPPALPQIVEMLHGQPAPQNGPPA